MKNMIIVVIDFKNLLKLLEKGEATGCGGLPDGHVGEQCWSICFDNECNSAHFLTLNIFACILYLLFA